MNLTFRYLEIEVSVMAYDEDEYLFISGIQHYNFCKRQWALLHIEQKWEENIKTVEGNIVHDRCHDDTFLKNVMICS